MEKILVTSSNKLELPVESWVQHAVQSLLFIVVVLFCYFAVVFCFVFTAIWFQMTFKGILLQSFCLLHVQVFSQFYSRDPFKSVSGWFLVQVCVDFDLGTCSDQHWLCQGPVQNCLNVDLAQETVQVCLNADFDPGMCSSQSQCWLWPGDMLKSVSIWFWPRNL